MPTKLPANNMRKEVMVVRETRNSTVFPYRFARTSGNVKQLVSLLMWAARKIPLRIKDRPKPMGIAAPSKK